VTDTDSISGCFVSSGKVFMVFSPFVFGTPPSACHVVIGVVDCNELVVSLLCVVQSDELLLVTKVSTLGDCNMLWFPVKAVCTSSHNKL
jgi:hypothetical protein